MGIKVSKEKVIEQFFLSGNYISDYDLDLEADIQAFAKSRGYEIKAYGSGVDEHDLSGSARYTMQLINSNPKLRRMYNNAINGNFGYNDSNYNDNESGGIFNRITGSFGIHLDNYKASSNTGRGRNNSQRSGSLPSFNIVWIIAIIVGLVLLYEVVGPVVYDIIMSGVILKLIFFIAGGFVTYKVLVSKNMGWPIYIKIIVLGAIWLVLLNYNW